MMKTAYGDICWSRSKVYERCLRFKNGREPLKDEPREGRSSICRLRRECETRMRLSVCFYR